MNRSDQYKLQTMTHEELYNEYILIRDKKSKLSKAKRDAIEKRVEAIVKRNS